MALFSVCGKTETFKEEGFIPFRVESFPLDLCLELVFLVRPQGYPHVRVAKSICVSGGQVSPLTSDTRH